MVSEHCSPDADSDIKTKSSAYNRQFNLKSWSSTGSHESVKNIWYNILSSGSFPALWRENILTPVHKKGQTENPENYRGIALSSHFCKLFCAILNSRLYDYFEANNTVPKHQIGFKKKSRTADHILTLKTLIDKVCNTLKSICMSALWTLDAHLTLFGDKLYSTSYYSMMLAGIFSVS